MNKNKIKKMLINLDLDLDLIPRMIKLLKIKHKLKKKGNYFGL